MAEVLLFACPIRRGNETGRQKIGRVKNKCLISALLNSLHAPRTAQKMTFSIKDFFSKCDQVRSFLQIWSYLLKKSLMENFIFLCTVVETTLNNYYWNKTDCYKLELTNWNGAWFDTVQNEEVLTKGATQEMGETEHLSLNWLLFYKNCRKTNRCHCKYSLP